MIAGSQWLNSGHHTLYIIGGPFENWNICLDCDGRLPVLPDSLTPRKHWWKWSVISAIKRHFDPSLMWLCKHCSCKVRGGHWARWIWKAYCALKDAFSPPAARMFSNLPFTGSFSWRDSLCDFLLHPVLLPTHLSSFQFWLDIINGNKSFPAYKINTEMVSGKQKEETFLRRLPCKQFATSITRSFRVQIRGLTWCVILIGSLWYRVSHPTPPPFTHLV